MSTALMTLPKESLKPMANNVPSTLTLNGGKNAYVSAQTKSEAVGRYGRRSGKIAERSEEAGKFLRVFGHRVNMPDIAFQDELFSGQYTSLKTLDSLKFEMTSSEDSALAQLGRNIEQGLRELVDKNRVGLCQVYPNRIAEYFFFEDVKKVKKTTRAKDLGDRIQHDTRKVTQIRYWRHKHNLVGAEIHRPRDVYKKLPKEAQEIITATPDFLMPMVNIVSGDLVRKESEIIGEFINVHDNSRTEFKPVEVPVERRRRIRRSRRRDPALCIGPYVLFGWEGKL